MKIAIMGSGGVGGYFGARLADAGNDVTFIARGAHLEAMLKDGLQVKSQNGDVTIKPVQAMADPADNGQAGIGDVDVVLFCPKLYGTIEAAELIKPIVGKNTIVVTLQNGVSGPDLITSVLGEGCVLGGSTYIVSHLASPGHIEHIGPAQIIFGELDGAITDRAKAFEAVCQDAGIDVTLTDNILLEMWRKYVPLTVMSGLTSVIRGPIGTVLGDPDLWAMAIDAVHEVVAVGEAKGIEFADDMAEHTANNIKGAPPETMSSMSLDLIRGNKMELPWLSAKVAEFGAELGIPTPTHKFMATVLKPFADGAD